MFGTDGVRDIANKGFMALGDGNEAGQSFYGLSYEKGIREAKDR